MKLAKPDYELITEVAFVHLLLAHYRNQLLHLFVPEAMLALSLHDNEPCNKSGFVMTMEKERDAFNILPHLLLHAGVALRRFTALHCALAREFVLPLKSVGEV